MCILEDIICTICIIYSLLKFLIQLSCFQNGITQLSQTQDFLAGQFTESLSRKKQLLSQAQELETQVRQLQSSIEVSKQLVNQMPQGSMKKNDRKRKNETEMENYNPNGTIVSQSLSNPKLSKKGKERKRRNSNSGKNSVIKLPTDSVVNSECVVNSNLSIRKLLENTKSTDLTKTADTKLKVNGYMESSHTDTDLSRPRPSLPISIPLDCLPGNNVRHAIEQVKVAYKDTSLSDTHAEESNRVDNVGIHATTAVNMNSDQLYPSLQNQLGQPKMPSWTSANFIPNSHGNNAITSKGNFAVGKIVPKKRGVILNGTSSELLKQSIVNKVEFDKNSLKRKGQLEDYGSAPKRLSKGDQGNAVLMSTSTGSPDSNTSTAMLISTANQPLAISAIPSPEVHSKGYLRQQTGKLVDFR